MAKPNVANPCNGVLLNHLKMDVQLAAIGMNLENIMVGGRSQSQRAQVLWLPEYNTYRMCKSIEEGNRKAGIRMWQAGCACRQDLLLAARTHAQHSFWALHQLPIRERGLQFFWRESKQVLDRPARVWRQRGGNVKMADVKAQEPFCCQSPCRVVLFKALLPSSLPTFTFDKICSESNAQLSEQNKSLEGTPGYPGPH